MGLRGALKEQPTQTGLATQRVVCPPQGPAAHRGEDESSLSRNGSHTQDFTSKVADTETAPAASRGSFQSAVRTADTVGELHKKHVPQP